MNKIDVLRKRAEIIQQIRIFFADRDVLEVETPSLSPFASVDYHLDSFKTTYDISNKSLYLQTSPEFHMKQLLADGIGSIYQICKAFRNGEEGNHHNPEFTILEWYRLDFSIFDLMDEIESLLKHLGKKIDIERISYRQLFLSYLNIDPFNSSANKLKLICQNYDKETDFSDYSRLDILNYLISHSIEGKIREEKKHYFVYNYPKEEAALAIINDDGTTAARFELYLDGVEICNGFQELCNPVEQEKRFQYENLLREKANKKKLPYSKPLIAAMQKGLPESSGVAVGLDRLISFLLSKKKIAEVMTFTIQNA